MTTPNQLTIDLSRADLTDDESRALGDFLQALFASASGSGSGDPAPPRLTVRVVRDDSYADAETVLLDLTLEVDPPDPISGYSHLNLRMEFTE